MSLRFAVVHEAEADFRTATELADRVLVEALRRSSTGCNGRARRTASRRRRRSPTG